MNYKEALEYMYSQLPMFHRIGAAAYKANLNNTLELDKITGYPHRNFAAVHVAGTNGKGSVSHMLASVFQESGAKTGLFTSPHIIDYRERMKINGNLIPEDFVIEFLQAHMEDFKRIQPSFFEMTFAMAMQWFSECKVDIAVIETGMGGRLDSTNVITPLISVITNIGHDHVQFLGNSHEAIAIEKAGIIKQGVPVIIGETMDATGKVFMETSRQKGSPILFADQYYTIESIASVTPDEVPWQRFRIQHSDVGQISNHHSSNGFDLTVDCPLLGNYQIKNVTTVIAVLEALKTSFPVLTQEVIASGIKNTIINTGLQGRWQVIAQSPLTICDIGHNTHGLAEVVKQIARQKYNKLHFVLGVVNDKDLEGMLQMLPKDAEYYFCKADIPRGLDAGELQNKAMIKGLGGQTYTSVANAYETAVSKAKHDDMIFVGGSAFTVAEVLSFNQKLSRP